jgi:hypothetical protein
MNNKDEIVLYQPDNSIQLEVRLEAETVWLTQIQMVELFQTTLPNVSMHIRNIFKERELDKDSTIKDFLIVQKEGSRSVSRNIRYYSLDVIISVGYRVRSPRGTFFRIWATKILKEYILKGYAVNYRIEQVEQLAIETEKRVTETEKKIDFFVRTALPPIEGVFYDGQIFDAYKFAADLIKLAKKAIILIDNYIDESTLMLLSKRANNVAATIYTSQISNRLQLDLQKHNAQYQPVTIKVLNRVHDRFLFIDNDVYHIGASLKDLGKKLFAFSKMELKAQDLLQNIIRPMLISQ